MELNEQMRQLLRDSKSKEEIEKLQQAAEQGDAEAQFMLGQYYLFDDDMKAVVYLSKAAEQGHAAAQCNLATCYSGGRGVAQNYEIAMQLYALSAEQGYADAQFYLGLFYKLMKDNEKASVWLAKAAEQGQKEALQLLEEERKEKNI